MAKESTYPTATLAQGDYLRGVDDPAGTPSTKNFEVNHGLANLLSGDSFDSITQSGTPPTYTITAADFGKTLVTNESLVNYITVATGLPNNFWCRVYQLGTGKTVIQDDGTTSVVGISSGGANLVATGAQRAIINIIQIADDQYVIDGANLAHAPFANSYCISMTHDNAGKANRIDWPTVDLSGETQMSFGFWFKSNLGSSLDACPWRSSDNANHIRLDNSTDECAITIASVEKRIGFGVNIDNNIWRLIGINYNAGSCEVFLDGVSVGTSTGHAASLPSGYSNMSCGQGPQSFGDYIDSIGVWTGDVLAAAEWLTLYNSLNNVISFGVDSGNYTSSSALKHWWRCGDDDGGTGSTVTDNISGANGTLVGDAAFTNSTVPGS